MTRMKCYPAAAASVVVLGCGASTDNGTGTGGRTSIDGGTPMSTSGGMVAYYGMLVTGGNAAGGSSATATGGKTAQTTTNTGGQGMGGYITIYGPRFDKLANNLVSTGGSNACIVSNSEGGAMQGFEDRTCDPRGSR
jgi:hypothetical protein